MPVSPERRPAALDAEVIWQEFHGRLLGSSLAASRIAPAAEDVLQEVVIRIHRHAAEMKRVTAVGAWVHRIAVSDRRPLPRAPVRRERPSGLALDGHESRPPGPSTDELRGELAAYLRPLLERLPAIHRQALTLTELTADPSAGGGSSWPVHLRDKVPHTSGQSRAQEAPRHVLPGRTRPPRPRQRLHSRRRLRLPGPDPHASRRVTPTHGGVRPFRAPPCLQVWTSESDQAVRS